MKVFVSYALSDREWVTRFAASLRGIGAEVNSWGSSFLTGDPPEMLERRMAAVDFVVLVLSEDFLACGHVLNELGMARLLGKPITSVLIEPGREEPGALEASSSSAARKIRHDYATGRVLAG